MDYDGLVAAVASRLNRADLTGLIPDFIARAEDEINARLCANPIRPMATSFTQDVTEQEVALPDDFVDVIDLALTQDGETWSLVRLDPSDPSDFYATRALPYRTQYDSTKIRHYSILGESITLSDTPSESVELTLKCYVRLPALVDNDTNWMSERHADVYEFGALAHAYRHIRDDEARDRYLDLFLGAFDMMAAAYPERQNMSERRAFDAPWSVQRWNITNG